MGLERLRDHIRAVYLAKGKGRNKIICQGREYPDGTGTLCG